MLDRLERAGYVRREHDQQDRRRVMIHPVPKALAVLQDHYQGMAKAWSELLATYSDQQLALFLELFERMLAMSQAELKRLDRQRATTGARESTGSSRAAEESLGLMSLRNLLRDVQSGQYDMTSIIPVSRS